MERIHLAMVTPISTNNCKVRNVMENKRKRERERLGEREGRE